MAANLNRMAELVVWPGPAATHVKIVTHGGLGNLPSTVVMNPAGDLELELEQLAIAVAPAMAVHIDFGISLVSVHVVRSLRFGTTCDMFYSGSSCPWYQLRFYTSN